MRIESNRCTISLDTSGTPLHRRGWRLRAGKAPLREDLAHALVLASGWDKTCPLLDPMCGSGTILIEAATLARRLAPGRLRSFAVEHTLLHDAALLAELRAQADHRALDRLDFQLLGSDRDAEVLPAAQENAERAGVLEDLTLRRSSLSTCLDELPGPAAPGPQGALVTNPPYGRRLGANSALPALYRTLGNVARQLPPAWCVALAAADRRLALRSGLDLHTAFLADSGGLKIRALTTARKEPPSGHP